MRAEGNEGPLVRLFTIALDLLGGLHALAANGNKMAARVWANTLEESIGNFEMLAFHKPEIFIEWARGSFAIPGMISQNAEKTKSNQTLVERLQVGAKCDFAIVPKGKRGRHWQFQDRANGLAARLQSHIEWHRTLYCVHELRAKADKQKLPAWLRGAAKLPPFSPKTWKAWAKIGWLVLAEISPNAKPGKHRAFYEPATAICTPRMTRTNPYYGNEERAPSIAENDIKEALFGAFELIATGISRKTKQRTNAAANITKQ